MTDKRKLDTMSFEEILADPVRNEIVRSILSRENASSYTEIMHDVNKNVPEHASSCYYHLHALIKCEVIGQDDHPTKPGKMYYISPKHEELQPVLQKLFPVEYDLP